MIFSSPGFKSFVIFLLVFVSLTVFIAYVQFMYPSFSEADEYLHIAIARLVKNHGVHYDFPWAKFSTFKRHYSDKDVLFHILSVPFLSLSKNIIVCGKYAIIFFNTLFILSLFFILTRYVPVFLGSFLILLLYLNSPFILYITRLRPATLANIFTILGIYYLIKQRYWYLFILSVLFPLIHLSFFTIIIFAIICELIRLCLGHEFDFRNILIVSTGSLLGCLLHPNNPNNWLSIHLNAFLTSWYSFVGLRLGFGNELYSRFINQVFIGNFSIFFIIFGVLLISMKTYVRASLATFVWFACLCFYLFLSLFQARHWYTTSILSIIFFASFLHDWFLGKPRQWITKKARIIVIGFVILGAGFYFKNMRSFMLDRNLSVNVAMKYENAAYWMSLNLPPKEIVYHTNWDESPYFILFNPKDYYINVLDPIYMFYAYPEVFIRYKDLYDGKIDKPYSILKRMLHLNYGYASVRSALHGYIKNDGKHFKILYNDNYGIVFKILNPVYNK